MACIGAAIIGIHRRKRATYQKVSRRKATVSYNPTAQKMIGVVIHVL